MKNFVALLLSSSVRPVFVAFLSAVLAPVWRALPASAEAATAMLRVAALGDGFAEASGAYTAEEIRAAGLHLRALAAPILASYNLGPDVVAPADALSVLLDAYTARSAAP